MSDKNRNAYPTKSPKRELSNGAAILEQLRHRIDGLGDCWTPLGNIFHEKITEIAERVVAGSFQVSESADIFARRANAISGLELAFILEGLE